MCFFVSECGRGKSYRSRLLFIDICKFIMELFSRRFFKENFFEFLLELGSVGSTCGLITTFSVYQTSGQCFSCALIGYSKSRYCLLFTSRHCSGFPGRVLRHFSEKRNFSVLAVHQFGIYYNNYSAQCR